MAVPTKEYVLAAPVEIEAMSRLEFEWTKDGEMCQIHVTTSRGRTVMLNSGLLGVPEFKATWDGSVPSDPVLQALFNLVPDLPPEQRGVAIAAPEPQ